MQSVHTELLNALSSTFGLEISKPLYMYNVRKLMSCSTTVASLPGPLLELMCA